jgi:hypothetical protein
MNVITKRSILRWIHLVFAIPIAGYCYSPFENLPSYSPVVRYIAFPAIVLTGLGMGIAQLVRRRTSQTSA